MVLAKSCPETCGMQYQPIHWISVGLAWVMLSCQPEPISTPTITTKVGVLSFEHAFEGALLVPAQLQYENEAGNLTSVTRLEYVISQLKMEDAAGQQLELVGPWYVNAFDQKADTIQIKDFKPVRMRFLIGLDSAQNRSNRHDDLPGFINLAWPEIMGGGYHFLKLEGRFQRISGGEAGYAFHLGKAQFRVPVAEVVPAAFDDSHWRIRMEVSKWFGPPVLWDLQQHATMTMHSDSAMGVLSENGRGVFHEE